MVHHQPVAGREHIPHTPKGFIAIRIIQLVLGIVILGLDAYGLSLLAFSGDALNMFTAVATLIACIYFIVAHFGPVHAYNYWAVLGLDIFLCVFWLISFALMAAQVAPFMKGTQYCDYYYGTCTTYELSGTDLVFASCMAAVAGLGGLEFVLFAIAVVVNGLGIHRHRKAGLHCVPGAAATPAAGTTTGTHEPKPAVAAGTGAAAGAAAGAGHIHAGTTPVQQGHGAVYPAPTYPQQQQQPGQDFTQHQQYQQYPPQQQHQQYATPPPQNAQVYPAPTPEQQQHQPQPYYPQQQQQQVAPSPIQAQHTGYSTQPDGTAPVQQQQQQQQQQSPVMHQPQPQHPHQGQEYHEAQA